MMKISILTINWWKNQFAKGIEGDFSNEKYY